MSVFEIDTLVAVASLEATLYPLGQFAEQTTELAKRYPQLEPELITAQNHCLEAASAITRAVKFLQVKSEVT